MAGQPEQLAESGRLPESERLAGPRRAPEAPRPNEAREARDIGAELQARLERLPLSHPSCPYNSDGSRKPPEADPRERELPLPPEAERTDLPEEDGPRIDPDGSWHWKGRDLSPDQNRIADEALARFRTAEGRDADGNYGDHGLTPAMRRIESQLEHGRLVPDTEKFALKSPDRLKEKLAARISRYPNAASDELASDIHDGIRYTFTFEFERYTEGMEAAQAKLTSDHEHLETRPSWHMDEYKGVNSRWRERDSGVVFEVQFHTRESWEAKQATHDAYEKIKSPRTPISEVERLRTYQREVSAAVRIPPGALEIRQYPKEEQA